MSVIGFHLEAEGRATSITVELVDHAIRQTFCKIQIQKWFLCDEVAIRAGRRTVKNSGSDGLLNFRDDPAQLSRTMDGDVDVKGVA